MKTPPSIHRLLVGGSAAIAVTCLLIGAANAAAILVFDTFYGKHRAVPLGAWIWPNSHLLAGMALSASVVMYLAREDRSTAGNLLAAASVLVGVLLAAVWMVLGDTMLAASTFGPVATYGVLHRGVRNTVWPFRRRERRRPSTVVTPLEVEPESEQS